MKMWQGGNERIGKTIGSHAIVLKDDVLSITKQLTLVVNRL